jgi:hypothetical protein
MKDYRQDIVIMVMLGTPSHQMNRILECILELNLATKLY